MKYAVFLFLIVWWVFNKGLIVKGFASWDEKHRPVLATVKFIRENREAISKGSVIYVPKQLGHYGAGMLGYLYKDLSFMADVEEEKTQDKYVLLKYDPSEDKITRQEISEK